MLGIVPFGPRPSAPPHPRLPAAAAVAAAVAAAAIGLSTLLGAAAPAAAATGDAATAGSSTLPTQARCGDQLTVTATMRNDGTTTWGPETHRLVVTGDGAPASVALRSAVVPAATATFAFTIAPPSASATTPYSWQVASDAPFGARGSASVTVRCALDEVFRGVADFVEDETFAVDRPDVFRNDHGGTAHGETSTVDLGPSVSPRYRMFYRSFLNPDGTKRNDGVPAGIAMATSTDGDRWTVTNAGRPVYPWERSEPKHGSTSCATPECIKTFEAPTVVVEPDGSLTMAHEIWDTGINPPAPVTEPVWSIGFARSTNGGQSWTKVLDAAGQPLRYLGVHDWEGFDGRLHHGNIGTPDLARTGAGYVLTYHAWGVDGYLRRGLLTGPSIDALDRLSTATMGPGPGWELNGVGKASDVREGPYLYRVYEAFRGSSGCGNGFTTVGWGIARSVDDGRTWERSAQNPIRVGRKEWSCGDDLPNFQLIPGRDPMVVTTEIHAVLSSQPTLKRFRVSAPRPAPATSSGTIVAVVHTASGNGYWQLDDRGGVHAFGTAATFGSGLAAGRSDFVSMAARPDGTGYWLVTATGKVYAFGAAAAAGDLATSGQKVVAVQSSASGRGYWLATATGRVSAFGDARAHGAMKKPPASPVVAMATRPAGDGYWLVTAKGGVTAYGAATSHGSLAVARTDVVGMAVRPDGRGYWLVNRAGEIWAFGSGTANYGSTAGYRPVSHFDIAGVAPRTTGSGLGTVVNGLVDQSTGLLLVAVDGGIVDFGSARDLGSARTAAWAT